MTSPHLESIITQHHGSAHLQVVFVDIVGYAKRKRANQFAVINDFTRLVNASLDQLGRSNPEYTAARGVDFHRDVIKVATGFGLAVVFAFSDLPAAPAEFGRRLAEAAHQHNHQAQCRQFEKTQWCNCHSSFQLNIVEREGEGVIYREMNDAYGIADSTVDFAQRIPGRDDDNGELVGVGAGAGPRVHPGILRVEL